MRAHSSASLLTSEIPPKLSVFTLNVPPDNASLCHSRRRRKVYSCPSVSTTLYGGPHHRHLLVQVVVCRMVEMHRSSRSSSSANACARNMTTTAMKCRQHDHDCDNDDGGDDMTTTTTRRRQMEGGTPSPTFVRRIQPRLEEKVKATVASLISS